MAIKIIVEGCDGVGKTTYIEKLKELLPKDTQVIHCTRETPNTFEYFKSLLLDDNNYIFDRFHVGQFIYQTEEERKAKGWLTKSQLKKLEKIIKRTAQLIYVETYEETIYHNCKRDKDDNHYELKYIRSLLSKYNEFFAESSVPVIRYFNDYNPMKARLTDWANIPLPKRIIAVDFDDTLTLGDSFPDCTHALGNLPLIKKLKKAQEEGAALILWTNREGTELKEAVYWCESHGLYFDAINDNLPKLKAMGFNPRKIWATEYWDDKARVVKPRYNTRGDLKTNETMG